MIKSPGGNAMIFILFLLIFVSCFASFFNEKMFNDEQACAAVLSCGVEEVDGIWSCSRSKLPLESMDDLNEHEKKILLKYFIYSPLTGHKDGFFAKAGFIHRITESFVQEIPKGVMQEDTRMLPKLIEASLRVVYKLFNDHGVKDSDYMMLGLEDGALFVQQILEEDQKQVAFCAAMPPLFGVEGVYSICERAKTNRSDFSKAFLLAVYAQTGFIVNKKGSPDISHDSIHKVANIKKIFAQ